jgi:membrane-bound lytic murein transglycosylase B
MFYTDLNLKNYIILVFCAFALVCFSSRISLATTKPQKVGQAGPFASLQQRLIKDGFDKAKIADIYCRPEVSIESIGVPRFFKHSEAKVNYSQFYSKKSIRKAKKYIIQHKKALESTEKKFGVEKEVITAIMLVETRLGTMVGTRSVLNTLSTMASLSDAESREELWKSVSASEKAYRKKFDQWSDRKSKWAYIELKAFLKHTIIEGVDPVGINGSYAGAMGIAQFMPSNIITLAKDGNQDGRIDLFTHDDAIASIANYLKHYGWYPGIDGEKAYKVLYRYNHSKYYVNTLLEIAERLKS